MYLYFLLLLLVPVGYYLELPTITYQTCLKGRKRLKRLTRLVSTTNTNKLKIIKVCMELVLKAVVINLLQKMYKSIEKVDKNKYILTYYLKGRTYKVVVSTRQGPSKIFQVLDKDDNDVTDVVEPYLGPNEDFHGLRVTPGDLGYDRLVFNMSDTREHEYERGEEMTLRLR